MISNTKFWISVISMAFGTFAIRSSFILLSSKFKISKKVELIFSYIPAAVLPALLMPMVFFHKGEVELLLSKERLVVLFFATLVCFYTKSMLATVTFGLITLYLLKYFL